MHKPTMIAALATVLFATGCQKAKDDSGDEAAEAGEQPKAEAPAIDVAAEEQAIRNRSAEWMNYANAKDVPSIAKFFSPDAITAYDGRVSRGATEIQSGMEKQMAENPKSVISWSTKAVRVAKSGDLAYETGDIYFDPDGAEGKKPGMNGAFVTVWEKADGNWRVVADAGTENVKPQS